MTTTLTKDLTTITAQPDSYQVWHPAVTRSVTTTNALTATAYNHYKNWLFEGDDFSYVIQVANGSYYDVYDKEISTTGYMLSFYTASTVAPFNVATPYRLSILKSSVIAGSTRDVTTAGYWETVTPAPVQVVTNLIGWNGSASSVGSFTGNGNAQFKIKPLSSGVVAGLVQSGSETGSAYTSIQYAIYADNGSCRIVESGVAKTPLIPFDTSKVFVIQKQGTEVEYLLDGALVYKSLIASSGALTMVLDVSLYSGGDGVIDASIASGLSASGWKSTTITYIGSQDGTATMVGNASGTSTVTGTGSSGGTGSFTGTQVTTNSYTGTLTGTLTDTSDGDKSGAFTGTYTLINNVWVFTANTGGWTWNSIGLSSGTATFSGTQTSPTSYTGTLTGTLTGTSIGDVSGVFDGVYNLVDGVWVFTANTGGWTWDSAGSPAGTGGTFTGTESPTGTFTGSFTGTVLNGTGAEVTGTFTGTLVTTDGGLTYVFTGTGADTGKTLTTTPTAITATTSPVVPVMASAFELTITPTLTGGSTSGNGEVTVGDYLLAHELTIETGLSTSADLVEFYPNLLTPIVELPPVFLPVIQSIPANQLTITPVLPALSIGQIIVVGANPLTVTPDLPASTVAMVTALSSNPLTIDSTLTAVAIEQTHALTPNNLTIQSTLPSPTINQIYLIDVNELVITPTLSSPAITQVHVVPASALTIESTLPAVDISSISVVDAVALTVTSILEKASVEQVHALTPRELNTALTLPVASVFMIEVVTPNELTITPSLPASMLTIIHAIATSELVITPTLTAATVAMLHDIGARELSVVVDLPVVDIGQIYIINANPLTVSTGLFVYGNSSDTLGGTNSIALNFSVDNKSMTTFSNMPFIGSCVFNGKTLFINDQGLFEAGGLTDNGTAITPSFKTGKMDTIQGRGGLIHSNQIKRIPDAKIKVSCDKAGGTLDLYVTVDTDSPDHYEHAITHDGFATHDVRIGRGTIFNFIQLEVTAHGCSKLNISSLEYNPVANVRNER